MIMLDLIEFRVLDHNAVGMGISLTRLMEKAGAGVADQICERWEPGKVILFCGPGNNGGDGFVAARHLRQAGWEAVVVVVGANGPEGIRTDLAREAWESDAGRFELIMSDLVLPDGRGSALVLELLERDPSLRVLIVTGYPNERLEWERQCGGRHPVLHKPFSVSDLLSRIAGSLSDGPPET